jgi:hypothetical protein
MTPVATRPAPPRPRNKGAIIGAVAAGVVAASVLAAAWPQLQLPAQIDEITVRNPHPWSADVAVTDEERDGWLGLGSLPRESSYTFHGVINQGEVWVFAFGYAGVHVEQTMQRDELERENWIVTVPDEFAQRLQAAGVFETPPGAG